MKAWPPDAGCRRVSGAAADAQRLGDLESASGEDEDVVVFHPGPDFPSVY
ncbi:MAG TPA: hypothetical protein VML55_13685 [Planctomycetaceae bacterium]|nr:hypothetical protein [Planctomycetaceae bacterium]